MMICPGCAGVIDAEGAVTLKGPCICAEIKANAQASLDAAVLQAANEWCKWYLTFPQGPEYRMAKEQLKDAVRARREGMGCQEQSCG